MLLLVAQVVLSLTRAPLLGSLFSALSLPSLHLGRAWSVPTARSSSMPRGMSKQASTRTLSGALLVLPLAPCQLILNSHAPNPTMVLMLSLAIFMLIAGPLGCVVPIVRIHA